MARSHGKKTIVNIAAANISPHCKTSSLERGAKTSDLTGYAPAGDAEVHGGGLKNAKFTVGGVYDNTVSTGPRLVLAGNEGDTMAIIYQIEGAGTGLPQDLFDAILEKYAETAPHDDYVTWSADFKVTGPIDSAAQA